MRLGKALAACHKHKPGIVYVIIERGAINGPCKIGFTYRLSERLSNLQTGNHRVLETYKIVRCDNPQRIERVVHSALADYRIVGEWFAVSALDAIDAVRNAMVGFD